MDGYPDDQQRVMRQMQRDLTTAQASAGRRQPLIEASAGWVMRNRSTPPAPPSGDVHIYAQGGRLWARSTLGDVPLLPIPDPPQAGFVGAPSSVQAPVSLDSGALAAAYNQLRLDVINTVDTLADLIVELKSSSPPIVSPF
ncbi:hypothetical protein ACFXJ8_11835 [Nonomuraea sp. NPDC059194]|uniref:hypothetical protein n=1 Tax=Nonomuraea sp. NPDC059194 TaxID=3346764 RepID=UPI0036AC8AB8